MYVDWFEILSMRGIDSLVTHQESQNIIGIWCHERMVRREYSGSTIFTYIWLSRRHGMDCNDASKRPFYHIKHQVCLLLRLFIAAQFRIEKKNPFLRNLGCCFAGWDLSSWSIVNWATKCSFVSHVLRQIETAKAGKIIVKDFITLLGHRESRDFMK